MQLTQKIIFSLRIITVVSTCLIVSAILFFPRGDTFKVAKASLQAQHELDVLEANYLMSIRGRNIEVTLPKVFYNQASRYSMRYPANWVHEPFPNMFRVNGKEGTTSFLSHVNIQTIRTKQSGGLYTSAADFIDSIKLKAGNNSNFRIVESGPIVLYLLDGTPVQGEYLIFTYSDYGLAFKQWQVAVRRTDGRVIYVWAYNAPLTRFESDYTTAKAMLKSMNFF